MKIDWKIGTKYRKGVYPTMKLAQKSPAAPDARHPQERRAFLYVFLLAVVLTLVVELFNHKAFTSGTDSFLEFV